MIERTRLAGAHGELRGVLFSHGESAARSREVAEAWPGQFIQLIENLRRDFSRPGLPAIFAQLGTISATRRTLREHGYQAWDYLKELQAGIRHKGVYMIRTDDLELKPDGIHLSTRSQIEAGVRFAELVHQTVYQHCAGEHARRDAGTGR